MMLPRVSRRGFLGGLAAAVLTDRAIPALAAAVPEGPIKQIVVQLGTQTLVAYQNGSPVLTTPVTTGRPGLETPTGTTSVFAHYAPYLFISPWPESSPYYYPPSWVTWAMEFRSGGYFLHDAPWEPSWAFGQGSEYSYYASHGCVHIPYYAMSFLYNWTPNGTPVTVTA